MRNFRMPAVRSLYHDQEEKYHQYLAAVEAHRVEDVARVRTQLEAQKALFTEVLHELLKSLLAYTAGIRIFS